MRRRLGSPLSLLLICVSVAVASDAHDTARLAAHLRAIRGKKWLKNAEYRSVQNEYLDWIDSRVKSGSNADEMNRELQTAGLFARWPKTPDEPEALDEIYASHAGYVEPISTKPIRSRGDIFVIAVGIYKGDGCSLD